MLKDCLQESIFILGQQVLSFGNINYYVGENVFTWKHIFEHVFATWKFSFPVRLKLCHVEVYSKFQCGSKYKYYHVEAYCKI
jgi:hypothetical protein